MFVLVTLAEFVLVTLADVIELCNRTSTKAVPPLIVVCVNTSTFTRSGVTDTHLLTICTAVSPNWNGFRVTSFTSVKTVRIANAVTPRGGNECVIYNQRCTFVGPIFLDGKALIALP